MAAFLGAGALALAIAAAAAAAALLWYCVRRRRRDGAARRDPPEVIALVTALRAHCDEHHPGVRVRGLVPARGGVLIRVDGQDTVIPIAHLLRQVEAFPEAFAEIVAHLVEQIRVEALDRIDDHRFLDVFPDLLPQLKTTEWLRDHSPPFGDSALVHKALGADLIACYVIDGPSAMLFVCQGHLRRWGRSVEDLHALAMRNLRARGGIPLPGARDPVLLHTGDGYDAARVLLLDPNQGDGLLVAVPEKNTLWLAHGGDVDLAELMQDNARQSRASSFPVSPHLYRMQEGRLARVEAADEPPPRRRAPAALMR